VVGTADWYYKDCRFDFDWVLWRCFSCWLSLQKWQEMKFSYTEWGTGLKSEYQISHPVMWSSFLFLAIRRDSFPTHRRGWQRGGHDPVSRTNFNKIHASRFESVIVGETLGKRNFYDQTQIIQESRIPHEINHASHAFRYSRITFLFK